MSGFVSFKESDLTVVVGVAVVVAMVVAVVVVVVRGRVVDVKPDVIVDTCVVAGSTAVSEAAPQAEAHKSKQTTAPNFFIPSSLPHHVRVAPVGYRQYRYPQTFHVKLCNLLKGKEIKW